MKGNWIRTQHRSSVANVKVPAPLSWKTTLPVVCGPDPQIEPTIYFPHLF